MVRTKRTLGVAALVATIAACGSSREGELTVQGTVSQELAVDDARAIAIGADGRTYWAQLDAQRDFTLTVPSGQSYRVAIANARPDGDDDIVGQLVLTDGASRTEWIRADEAATIDLGTLRAITPTTNAGNVTTQTKNGKQQGHDPKVTICHATGSATNPYVSITVSEHAVEAHRAHQNKEDIIPAPAGGCPGNHADDPPTQPGKPRGCGHGRGADLAPSNDPGGKHKGDGPKDCDKDAGASDKDAGGNDAGNGPPIN